jgi:predicted dehydrogenase
MPVGAAPTTIAVAGAGERADRWARALRGVEGVEITRTEGAGDDDLLESLSLPHVAAVAFTQELADLPGAVRRAVMARRHVFVATPVALASRQLLALDEVAHRRERTVLFDTPPLADEHLAFVRKMIGGPNALWRPRYMRVLRTGAGERCSLDELALHETAAVLALAGGLPASVSAHAPRADDESAGQQAALISLVFDGGQVARLDISLIEPGLRAELVVACEGRTIVLDRLDAMAPLRILASGRHRGPRQGPQWAETVTEHPLGETHDPAARAAALFVAAVRRGSADGTNARQLAGAALVWETARMSMARAGEALPLPTSSELLDGRRPALQVIRGGGHSAEGHPAPELTVIGRR